MYSIESYKTSRYQRLTSSFKNPNADQAIYEKRTLWSGKWAALSVIGCTIVNKTINYSVTDPDAQWYGILL